MSLAKEVGYFFGFLPAMASDHTPMYYYRAYSKNRCELAGVCNCLLDQGYVTAIAYRKKSRATITQGGHIKLTSYHFIGVIILTITWLCYPCRVKITC